MADDLKITFETNLPEVTEEIRKAVLQWLEESAAELQGDIVKLSRRDTSQTAASYRHVVDPVRLEAYIGSNLENAIWEEFGTGEYALNGDGRKGWWVYVKDGGDYRPSIGTRFRRFIRRFTGREYTYQEAKQIMAMLCAKGLDAHMTNGKRPNRPIYRALTEGRSKIRRGLTYRLKQLESK